MTDLEDTSLYYQQYGAYTEALNSGGLTIPMDSVCQWAFFCYVMFNLVKEYFCKVSIVNLFMKISDFYCFNASTKECSILSKIFLKNLCKKSTPGSHKESSQKLSKLSGLITDVLLGKENIFNCYIFFLLKQLSFTSCL